MDHEEVEVEEIEDIDPIQDMIAHIDDKNFTEADQIMHDMLGQRVQDMLDQEKIRVAGTVFNDAEEAEEEYEEEDEELEY